MAEKVEIFSTYIILKVKKCRGQIDGQKVHFRNKNRPLYELCCQNWYSSRAIASPGEFKYHFSGKEDMKKFFYVYENLDMKNKSEEETADNLVAYLDGEAFEYYFDKFTVHNAPNKEVRSLHKLKAEL